MNFIVVVVVFVIEVVVVLGVVVVVIVVEVDWVVTGGLIDTIKEFLIRF